MMLISVHGSRNTPRRRATPNSRSAPGVRPVAAAGGTRAGASRNRGRRRARSCSRSRRGAHGRDGGDERARRRCWTPTPSRRPSRTRSRCSRPARPCRRPSTRSSDWRAGVRAGAPARPPRRARQADGLLPVQQRRGGGRGRDRARALARVAIVDIDVHHGNGTQWMFYDDPRVLYVSTHQFPFYPGTGAADETGTGEGKGFTLNIPLAAGATRRGLRVRLTKLLPLRLRSSRLSCC